MYRLPHILFALWATVGVGCSGMVQQEVFTPSTNIEEKEAMRATFDLVDARLTVIPTVISEKLQALFAPLVVAPTPLSETVITDEPLVVVFFIDLDRGEAWLDLETSTIEIHGTEILRYPTEIAMQTIQHHPVGRSDYNWVPIEGPATIIARSAPYSFSLKFDIPRTNLDSFTFSFGKLAINGKTANIRPVIFTRAFRSIPK